MKGRIFFCLFLMLVIGFVAGWFLKAQQNICVFSGEHLRLYATSEVAKDHLRADEGKWSLSILNQAGCMIEAEFVAPDGWNDFERFISEYCNYRKTKLEAEMKELIQQLKY